MGTPVVHIFEIKNEHSQLVLEVEGEATTEGTLIEQYTDIGKKHQRWQLELVEHGPGGELFFNVKNTNSGMSLEVVGDSKEPGADIVQRYYGNGPFNRQWQIIRVDGKENVYKIKNRSSNLFLDDENGNKSAPAPVKQHAAYDADARQQWTLTCMDKTISEQVRKQADKQSLTIKADDAYGHLIGLYAHLRVTVTQAIGNQPVSGIPIRFSYGTGDSGEFGTKVTNMEGVAETDTGLCMNLVKGAASWLACGYTATFDGNAEYSHVSNSGTVHLRP